MDSRLEKLSRIRSELDSFIEQSSNEKLNEALKNIVRRIEEAERLIENREDSTGKPITVKTIGHYLLKTYRMTQESNLNKLLVKYAPGQYRKLTEVFGGIDGVAAEILSYDYKKIKQAEEDVKKIHPFLVKGENAFRTAAQRETDREKAAVLNGIGDDFNELVWMIYLGKSSDKSLCTSKDCTEKVTKVWEKIKDYRWGEFVSDELHNPVFIIQETTDKFEEVFEHYIERKFSVKKQADAEGSEKQARRTMQEDAHHFDIDPSKRKPLTKRSKLAPEGKKKGLPSGPVLSRKIKNRGTLAPIHRPGIDEIKPGFSPVKLKKTENEMTEEEEVILAESVPQEFEKPVEVKKPLMIREEVKIEKAVPPEPELISGKTIKTEEELFSVTPSVLTKVHVVPGEPKEKITVIKEKELEKSAAPTVTEEKLATEHLPPPSADVTRKFGEPLLPGVKAQKPPEQVKLKAQPSGELRREQASEIKPVTTAERSTSGLIRPMDAEVPAAPPAPAVPKAAVEAPKAASIASVAAKPVVEKEQHVVKHATAKPRSFEEEVMSLLNNPDDRKEDKQADVSTTKLMAEAKVKPKSFLSAQAKKKTESEKKEAPSPSSLYFERLKQAQAGKPSVPLATEEVAREREQVPSSPTEMIPPEEFTAKSEPQKAERKAVDEGVNVSDAVEKASITVKEKKGCLPFVVGAGIIITVLLIKAAGILTNYLQGNISF